MICYFSKKYVNKRPYLTNTHLHPVFFVNSSAASSGFSESAELPVFIWFVLQSRKMSVPAGLNLWEITAR